MDTCILFDVDGTLIDAGRAGSRAMAAVFRQRYGIENAFEGVVFDGMTDPWIIDRAAELRGVPPLDEADGERQRFYESYLDELHRLVHGGVKSRVHPGIRELLERLSGDGAALALATGNIAAGAREKLSPHDLNDYFPVGGFGDDHRERPELTRLAAERAGGHYGVTFEPDRVIVVGDSVRDVMAARANGFSSVTVCTGWTSRDDLLAMGPDLIFDDFSDPAPAAASILGCCDAG
jgi:phosphoglycolate phosphatase-like HAD superfamily hydrolase